VGGGQPAILRKEFKMNSIVKIGRSALLRCRMVAAVLVAVALVLLMNGHAFATSSDTAATAFDTGVDVGTSVTNAATAASTNLIPIVGVALALMVFGALWMWAKRGVHQR
jgi:hypothetical protein